MPDEVVSIRIQGNGADAVARQFRGLGKGLDETAAKAERSGRILRGAFGGIGPLARTLSGALGGIGLAAGAKRVLDFQKVLATIQVGTGKTNAEMQRLAAGAVAAGKAVGFTGQEVAGALQTFMDQGGIIDFGQQVLDQTLLFARAADIAPDAAASIVGALRNNLQAEAKDIPGLLNMIFQQANIGQLNPEQMARVAPELFSRAQAMGFKGKKGAVQVGTALQVVGGTFAGKPEEARTALFAMLRDLFKNADKLKRRGIGIFDKKGEIRNIDAILREIFIKTRGRMEGRGGLLKIFTDESVGAVNSYLGQFNQATGKFKTDSPLNRMLAASDAALSNSTALVEAYKTRLGGIGAEAEKVQRFWADVDSIVQEKGGSILKFISANPAISAVLGIGGYAGMNVAGGALSAAGGFLGGKALGAAGGALAGGAGAVAGGGALAVGAVGLAAAGATALAGWQIKRAIDEAPWAQTGALREEDPVVGQLRQLAAQLAGAGAAGTTSVQTSGGRVALSPEAAMAILADNAKRLGQSQEKFSELVPALQALVRSLARNGSPGSGGVDAPPRALARGL